MSAHQRRKGAEGERDAARYLWACACLTVERNARNGVKDAADLVGDGMVFEVKRRKSLAFHKFLKQAGKPLTDDWGKVRSDGTLCGVLSREDNGAWALTIPLWQAWTLFHLMQEGKANAKARREMAQHQQIHAGALPDLSALQHGLQCGSTPPNPNP